MHNLKGFDLLMKAGAAYGWPDAITGDRMLAIVQLLGADQAPRIFGACLRQYGATLFLCDAHSIRLAADVKAVFGDQAIHWLWYDGEKLLEVSYHEMIACLVAWESQHGETIRYPRT